MVDLGKRLKRRLPGVRDLQVLAGLAALTWGGEQLVPGLGFIAVGAVLIYTGLFH